MPGTMFVYIPGVEMIAWGKDASSSTTRRRGERRAFSSRLAVLLEALRVGGLYSWSRCMCTVRKLCTQTNAMTDIRRPLRMLEIGKTNFLLWDASRLRKVAVNAGVTTSGHAGAPCGTAGDLGGINPALGSPSVRPSEEEEARGVDASGVSPQILPHAPAAATPLSTSGPGGEGFTPSESFFSGDCSGVEALSAESALATSVEHEKAGAQLQPTDQDADTERQHGRMDANAAACNSSSAGAGAEEELAGQTATDVSGGGSGEQMLLEVSELCFFNKHVGV